MVKDSVEEIREIDDLVPLIFLTARTLKEDVLKSIQTISKPENIEPKIKKFKTKMENLYNKEKKLETVLNRLENLSKSSTGYLGEINDLYEEKNQLKIEKSEAENKYNQLLLEHDNLKRKLKSYLFIKGHFPTLLNSEDSCRYPLDLSY